MRDPILHIKRSDLVKVLAEFDNKPQQLADDIFSEARKYQIKNMYIIKSTGRTKTKLEKTVAAETGEVEKFNRLLHSLRMKANHSRAKPILKNDSNYIMLKEITKIAVDFAEEFKIKFLEDAFTFFISTGLELMGKRYAINKFKYYKSKIEERYECQEIINMDDKKEASSRFYKIWKSVLSRYANSLIDIETIEDFSHIVLARTEADTYKADYTQWIVAQFEGLAYLEAIPSLNQMYGINAARRYQKYTTTTAKKKEVPKAEQIKFTSPEQEEYFRIIIGNVHCQIEYEEGSNEYAKYRKLLREYLKIKQAGTQWMREHGYDGYRYFITDKGTFATGYLPVVISVLEDNGAYIEIEDERTNKVTFNSPINRTLPNGFTLTGYEPGGRGYQGDIVEKSIAMKIECQDGVIPYPRGIIDAATNAGKNSIMASLIQNANNPRVLFVCRMKTTFDEAVKFFSKMFKVTILRSGNIQMGNFTIAMQKTLYNAAKKNLKVRAALGKFNILFSDEAHESGGTEYSRLMTWVDAYARYFVSGTPLDMDDDVTKMIIVGVSGPIIAKISNKYLIDNKISLEPKIYIKLNRPVPRRTYLSYDEEYYHVVKFSKHRVEVIVEELRKRPNDKVYISFREIEHGEWLFNELWKYPDLRLKLGFSHGEDPERDIKVKNFTDGRIQIFVCSLILKQSINIPDINTLILTQGGKSKINVKQLIGRLVRDDGYSKTVDVIDFYDVGKWVEPHSRKRLRYYIDEQFEMNYNYPFKKNGLLKKT